MTSSVQIGFVYRSAAKRRILIVYDPILKCSYKSVYLFMILHIIYIFKIRILNPQQRKIDTISIIKVINKVAQPKLVPRVAYSGYDRLSTSLYYNF